MNFFEKFYSRIAAKSVWARPGMSVVFRAEIMPGKSREERTFRIKSILRNGRVTLHEFPGEYLKNSFEPINFQKEK
ncbi:MAG: hypothetical protein LC778_09065 [Acidobacteria bacterium]|nr:hypothetical protein [Acidobacteriota bacterium]